MKRYFALLVPVVGILLVAGPAAGAEDNYHRIIEEFFVKLKAGKSVEAVDFIYSGNPWISRDSDAVNNLKNQISSLGNLVGKYTGHEKLIETVTAGRFAYLYYFVSYDRQPLSFTFEFYRPKDKWMIFSFSFDADIDDEIESRAQEHFLMESK